MQKLDEIIAELKAANDELKASNDKADLQAAYDKADLQAALRAIDNMWNDSIQSWAQKSNTTVCYDRANDRIGLTNNGKTKFK